MQTGVARLSVARPGMPVSIATGAAADVRDSHTGSIARPDWLADLQARVRDEQRDSITSDAEYLGVVAPAAHVDRLADGRFAPLPS